MKKCKLHLCPSYPGYSVTEDGKLFSHRTRKGIKGKHGGTVAVINPAYIKEKSLIEDKKGYLRANIKVGQSITIIGIHALVLDAFTGPRPESMVARHLDGNKSNNNLSNLAWGTHLQNAHDRQLHGRYAAGGEHKNAKLTNEQADEVRLQRQNGCKVKSLAEKFNVSISTIESIIYGKSYKQNKNVSEVLNGKQY